MGQNASTVNLKNSSSGQSNVSSSNDWSNLDQLQNQYRQNRNARRLAAIAPSTAPSTASSAAPSAVNIPNQQLTPKHAAQKGINSMLKKQQQGFQRHNNDNATRNEAANALAFSQARNEKQTKNQKFRNEQNTALRAEAAKHAEITSNIWHNEEMKRQKKENSILLPKKPSNMTPLQIAQQLERDLQQLEGPIYASVLVPKPELERILGRKPPVFLLLGDIHKGINKCNSCAQTGCYSLYKTKGEGNWHSTFLDYLDDQTKKNWIIDLFFESWFGKHTRISPNRHLSRASYLQSYNPNKREEYDKNNTKHTSALVDWQPIFSNCVGYIQNPYNNHNDQCNYKHFRIHDSDVRKYGTVDDIHADNSFKPIMEMICDRIINWDKKNLSSLTLYFSLLINQFMPKVTFMGFINMIDDIYIKDTTIKDIIKKEYFQKSSRTVHELRQLPSELYDGIINNPELGFALNSSDNVVKNNRFAIEGCIKTLKWIWDLGSTSFNEAMKTENTRKNMDTFIEHAKITKEMMKINIDLETRLVDLYTISRALKPFKKGYETSLYSQLAVCYFGASHTYHTELLLKQWYEPHVMWGTRNLKLLRNFLLYSDRNEVVISRENIKCIRQIKNDSDDNTYPLSMRLYNIVVSYIEYEVKQYYKKSSTTLTPDDLAIFIKVGKIIINKEKAFSAFDSLEAFLIEKNKHGLLSARAHTDLIILLKKFIKRYEELYPENASASAQGGLRTCNNRSRRSRCARRSRRTRKW